MQPQQNHVNHDTESPLRTSDPPILNVQQSRPTTSTSAPVDPLLPSPFQLYYEDQSLLLPKNKIRLALGCCMAGIVTNFKFDALALEPFSIANHHQIRPTIAVIQAELKRRDPKIKGLVNLKLAQLLQKLEVTNSLLTDGCIIFLKDKYKEIRDGFELEIV